MIPLSLYVHFPWCIQKCPYCDFNSHQSSGKLPEDAYVDAVLADLRHDLDQYPIDRPLHSIFIGGGTPSLWSAHAIDRLINQIQAWLSFEDDIEITLEANPGASEQARFRDYRAAGINRLSIGVQSFNAKHLKALGRIHNEHEAYQAIDSARRAGFENINLDLMYGLPRQTLGEGLDDLSAALACEPEHLSWYQLTIEPNTVFYSTKPRLPSDKLSCELEAQGIALLSSSGFERYEISAYTRGKPSKHNLNYWTYGDYLGIGAGAHGKITDGSTGQIVRLQKTRMPLTYLNPDKPYQSECTQVSDQDKCFEFMLNTTRLAQPITNTLFTNRTGLAISSLLPDLEKAEAMGFIERTENDWLVTLCGRQYTNDLQALFLPDA